MSTLSKKKRQQRAKRIALYGDLKPGRGNSKVQSGKPKYLGGNGRKTEDLFGGFPLDLLRGQDTGGDSGFDALMAGYFDPHGRAYRHEGRTAAFWTSTPLSREPFSIVSTSDGSRRSRKAGSLSASRG